MSAASRTPPSGAAAEWINLGGLPGSTDSIAEAINDAGQVVGYSDVGGLFGGVGYATEWSRGRMINLGEGFNATAINDAGQVSSSSVYADLYERKHRLRITTQPRRRALPSLGKIR